MKIWKEKNYWNDEDKELIELGLELGEMLKLEESELESFLILGYMKFYKSGWVIVKTLQMIEWIENGC